MNVRVDDVQMVPDGFGFHLQASEYTWVTLVFETKAEAEAAHSHAAKAVAKGQNPTALRPREGSGPKRDDWYNAQSW